MDVFFAYLLVASATPLFLWQEHKRLAIFQIPVIITMWVMFNLYIFLDFGMTATILFGVLFAINVIIAHVTAFYVYIVPFIKQIDCHDSLIPKK